MEDSINAMGYSLANYWNDLVPKVNLDPIFGSPLRATEIQDLGKIVCGIVYDSDVNNGQWTVRRWTACEYKGD